ncbi:hypothetical protein ABDK56_00185 [Sphingomonas sp. ASV193]|uniref:hypothetical protein n=1 Tax=Sphingomonas sp. ASV193 TaxID=3144405 RepID=UPI0032E8C414
MRFSVPKPLHGWRGFVGEVGIIVLGVLIAMAAQQWAQDRSDREQVDTALAALKVEIKDHVDHAVEIETVAPCVGAQIDAIEQRLARGEGTIPRYTDNVVRSFFVLRMPSRSWSSSAWESVKAVDTLRRQQPALANRIYNYYGQVGEQHETTIRSASLNARLNALATMMPSASERLHFVEIAEELRDDVASLDLVAGQTLDTLAKARLLPALPDRATLRKHSGTLRFCETHGLVLAPVRAPNPQEG